MDPSDPTKNLRIPRPMAKLDIPEKYRAVYDQYRQTPVHFFETVSKEGLEALRKATEREAFWMYAFVTACELQWQKFEPLLLDPEKFAFEVCRHFKAHHKLEYSWLVSSCPNFVELAARHEIRVKAGRVKQFKEAMEDPIDRAIRMEEKRLRDEQQARKEREKEQARAERRARAAREEAERTAARAERRERAAREEAERSAARAARAARDAQTIELRRKALELREQALKRKELDREARLTEQKAAQRKQTTALFVSYGIPAPLCEKLVDMGLTSKMSKTYIRHMASTL